MYLGCFHGQAGFDSKKELLHYNACVPLIFIDYIYEQSNFVIEPFRHCITLARLLFFNTRRSTFYANPYQGQALGEVE
jgi:hypothetical protein